MNWKIAVIPGDGIGPEIVDQALCVLEKVGTEFGHAFDFAKYLAGGIALDERGIPLPEDTLEGCRNSAAILLGAVGGPKWDTLPGNLRPEKALLGLRKAFGLFANIRPALLHPVLKDSSPLRTDIVAKGIDLVIVRELTGGIYFGEHGYLNCDAGREAFDMETYCEAEVRRIAKVAFDLARTRRRKVTSVDKANVLESSRLWRTVVTEVAADYPDVACEHMLVDNAAMQIVRHPSQFDVIVTSNLFGDILSDEASMVTGSIGLLPSASLGAERPGMYEPIHGSAPDIAGRDAANPIATILSAAMLLRLSLGLEKEAVEVERAVTAVLSRNFRTADIMSPGMTLVGTREMGGLIVREIKA
ncbi:MAG: 3-isopropylmalate dehydrogenase [Candidatus Aminicenantales bacterium]